MRRSTPRGVRRGGPDAPAGPFKQEIFLKTNDPNCPLLPVLVDATIQAPLTASPDKVEFGMATVGQPVTKRVIVKVMGE